MYSELNHISLYKPDFVTYVFIFANCYYTYLTVKTLLYSAYYYVMTSSISTLMDLWNDK